MTPTVTIGPHRLFLGDAYETRPLLGFMDVDMFDPPYVIRTSGGGKFRANRPYLKKISEEGLDKGFDHKIINPLLAGAVVVFCHNDQVPAVSSTVDGLFHRFALCAWRKTNPMPVANKHYVPDIEIYFHAWNRGYAPLGEIAQLKRVFDCGSRSNKDFDHPTVKPDPLMNKIVGNVAGETICDAFMGSGSTGVAAVRAGRIFTGIEHNPKHFETAVRRITAAYQERAAA